MTKLGVPQGMVTITAKEVPEGRPDTDPQELQVSYPSLLPAVDYVADSVKIEISARSLKEPWSDRLIEPIIDEYLREQPYSDKPFPVHTVDPKRTFLEKAFLLHEEFSKPLEKTRHLRMSRHLYDLEKLMDSPQGLSALTDMDFYHFVINHRAHFHNVPIERHGHESIYFLPPPELLEAYRQDYARMQEQMIYGNTHEFENLIKRLELLIKRFRNMTNENYPQDEVISVLLEPKKSTELKFIEYGYDITYELSKPILSITISNLEGSSVTIPLTRLTDYSGVIEAKRIAHIQSPFITIINNDLVETIEAVFQLQKPK